MSSRKERLQQRRVYVHFNLPKKKSAAQPIADAVLSDPENKPHTIVFVCAEHPNATVNELRDVFATEYHTAFPRHTIPFDSHGIVTTA